MEASDSGLALLPLLIQLALVLLMVIGMWKVFVKAGQPGWAIIVPIYNTIVLIQVAGKPIWWFLLMFIPIVNIVITILLTVEIAKKFGKGGGFAAGLIFLPFIFYPILGFGSAEYQG
ncbi:MAG: DUF5684 domain-containing protein [Kiritimatiellae bacterium]|jgi:hypothetical protein|nr:DUF5684 domain-containing protein [Kiritimatiellia bacterium]